MPNIKSSKKRMVISAARHQNNMSKRSALKTALKKTAASLNTQDAAVAAVDLRNSIKILDESVTKGIIHKNQAARRKSRLTKKLNALAK